MALLRRGSSRITDENFNHRLARECAKSGEVTASLAWNDPSDLDLHAEVKLSAGGKGHISYRNKQDVGGYLDVDMHASGATVDEPVENIFWKKPPAGKYNIYVHMYTKRGNADKVPFRSILKREGQEDISVEGQVAARGSKCQLFNFSVDDDGSVTMGKTKKMVGRESAATAKGKGKAKAKSAAAKATAAAAKAKAKAKAKVAIAKSKAKAKAKAKSSIVAKGKTAKLQVYKGLKVKTRGGLTKDKLTKNKKGKVVSKRSSAAGKKAKWTTATAKARAEKGYTGFKAIKKAGSFYARAKEIMNEM